MQLTSTVFLYIVIKKKIINAIYSNYVLTIFTYNMSQTGLYHRERETDQEIQECTCGCMQALVSEALRYWNQNDTGLSGVTGCSGVHLESMKEAQDEGVHTGVQNIGLR